MVRFSRLILIAPTVNDRYFPRTILAAIKSADSIRTLVFPKNRTLPIACDLVSLLNNIKKYLLFLTHTARKEGAWTALSVFDAL